MRSQEEILHYQGANSQVAIKKTKEGKVYILKKYKKKTSTDPRDRYMKEVEFLEYMEKCNTESVPKVIAKNEKKRHLYLEFIEGNKIDKIDNKIINDITTFIKVANKPELINERMKLGDASEAINTLVELHKNLNERINQLMQLNNQNKLSKYVIYWLEKEVINEVRRRISKSQSSNQMEEFNIREIQKIASPSDVGIHNTIRSKNGKLYFIDFEYAGKDDLAKFACDWIIQPEKPFTTSQESMMIRKLLKKMEQVDQRWINRYEIIKPLLEMKWCLIMLNKLKDGTITEKQIFKTMQYYTERTNAR